MAGIAGVMMAAAGGMAVAAATAATGKRRLKLPFQVIRVPGATAIGQLEALRNSDRGYPILLGGSDDVESLEDNMSLSDRSFDELLVAAGKINTDAWLAERAAKDPDYYKPGHGEWPARAQPNSTMVGHLDLATGKPRAEVFIGILPLTESWKVPCALRFGGWNACPLPEEHSAMFRRWYDRYGANVVTVTSDVIEMRVQRPPSTREQALSLAREQFVYCADIVQQGTGTIEALAASLLGASVWFFWWD